MVTEVLKAYPKREIVEVLQEFLTEKRIQGIDMVLSKRVHDVQIGIEAPYDIHNGLAVVRTAEALGMGHVHFINAIMKKGQGKNTTKGTLKWVHLESHVSFEGFMKDKGSFFLVGACADESVCLEELPTDRPLCFLFGNEKKGLSNQAKKHCDLLFRIPMFGMVESLNLSVAAGITLYDYLKRKRKEMGKDGDLTEEKLLEEKARFYVRSLGVEQSSEILKRSLLSKKERRTSSFTWRM